MITTTLLLMAAAPTLRVRVEGDGYLRFANADRLVYASRATLTVVGGALATPDGAILLPRIVVPASASRFSIDLEGNVQIASATIGRIVLADFPDGNRMTELGAFFVPSLRPKLANPGEGRMGVIRTDGGPAPVQVKTVEGKANVVVNARSEIEGETILLREIAAITGPAPLVERLNQIELGPAPYTGTERGIASVHVSARVRSAGINPDRVNLIVPAGAVVVRQSQKITTERLLAEAQEAVRRALGLETEFTAVKPPLPVMVPPGEPQIVPAVGVPNSSGVTVALSIKVGERLVSTRSVSLVPLPGNRGVQKGEAVRVRLVRHGAVIEMDGKSLSAGWVGQAVTVETVAGDKPTIHTGTVRGPGVVEVKL